MYHQKLTTYEFKRVLGTLSRGEKKRKSKTLEGYVFLKKT